MEKLMHQILTRLEDMANDITSMKQQSSSMERDIASIKQQSSSIESDIASMKQQLSVLHQDQRRMEQKVDGIYQSVVRIEDGQPKDIYAMLENVEHKQSHKDSEISVLNKRIFKLETEIEKFAKQ